MEHTYAQALWNMIEEGTAPSKALRALRDSLKENGRESLLPRIGRAFARIAERETRRSDMVLTVAREKDERKVRTQVKEVIAKLGIDGKDLKTRIDDTLIGGWRLEGRGHLVDASFKKQLLTMYNRTTQ
jgi:F0F1-type ATP synthase delta subunit